MSLFIQELKQEHERLTKLHVEKYESCLAELKALEARHVSELSRSNLSSNTALSDANAEKQRLEKELETLKREKNGIQEELEQIEKLLMMHTTSEKQLKQKLEESQKETSKLAAAVKSNATEKKRREEEHQQNLRKMKELEKELLNLQVNRKNSSFLDAKKTVSSPKSRSRERSTTKTPPVTSSYKNKSILKHTRKTRSSPPSPITTNPNSPYEKRITFDLDFSSDSSPVKQSTTSPMISTVSYRIFTFNLKIFILLISISVGSFSIVEIFSMKSSVREKALRNRCRRLWETRNLM